MVSSSLAGPLCNTDLSGPRSTRASTGCSFFYLRHAEATNDDIIYIFIYINPHGDHWPISEGKTILLHSLILNTLYFPCNESQVSKH